MRIQSHIQVGALGALVFIFIATSSHGQVDPEWLKSWNEADESRPAVLTSRGRIAGRDEPGVPLVIHGEVLNPDGTPADSVVVHAYHRDSDGFEFGPNDNSETTWRLQGWVKSDAEGRFEFHTIRPAPDHVDREAAHVHFTLVSSEYGRQWANKVFLSDDTYDAGLRKEFHRRALDPDDKGRAHDVSLIEGVQHTTVRFKLDRSADF